MKPSRSFPKLSQKIRGGALLLTLFILLVGLLLTGGCAIKPAPDAGFIAGSQFTHKPRYARFLQRVWISPKMEKTPLWQQFDAIYIAKVNTSHLAKQTWWQSQTGRESFQRLSVDTEALGDELRQKLGAEITRYPGSHYRLATAPGRRVLVIELAIVELAPSKAFWNTGADAAGFVLPAAALLSSFGSGSIAIEGRLRDGRTGKIFAIFADRREDAISPVNLREVTWYGGAKRNLAIWAREGAEYLNRPPGTVIHRKSRLTLKPW